MISIASILIFAFIPLAIVDGAVTYKHCTNDDAFKLDKLEIRPHPIIRPGSGRPPNTAEFHLNLNVKAELTHPIKSEFKLSKKVLGFWFAAPCTDGVGSCTYPDWCAKFGHCSFLAGPMNLMMPMNISSDTPSGDYKVEIRFTSRTNQKACVAIDGIQMK